jgi:hypothetical protein
LYISLALSIWFLATLNQCRKLAIALTESHARIDFRTIHIERELSAPLVLGQPLEVRHYAQSMDQLIQQLELSLQGPQKD